MLFLIMEDAPVREGGVLRDVLRMPDLGTVLWRLMWHSIKILPVVIVISVAAVLLLQAGLKLVGQIAIPHLQNRQLNYIRLQIGLFVETVLMSRYSLAIPFMVLGETDAKAALRRSREAVRSVSWWIESLSALEYLLLVLIPSVILRWTGHSPTAAHPIALDIEGLIDLVRAIGSTWFVLGLALIAKNIHRPMVDRV
jgi:hypothetical protein